MENAETSSEGAARETLEEACARVKVGDLYALFDIPHINQVYLLFRAQLLDLDFSPGIESLEVGLFTEQEIPWNELAFAVVKETLERYFKDRSNGAYAVQVDDIRPM